MSEELAKHTLPIIHLFKGILYDSNESVWRTLLENEIQVRDYFRVVGLELIINEAEGFAFLRQRMLSEETISSIPKLVEKRQLSFPVSILAILLRKKLLEFDNKGNEARLVLKKSDIVELLIPFLPNNTSNEKKIIDKIDTYITRLLELGFLRELKNEDDYYEVSRILIAYLPVEQLQLTLDKLNEYQKTIGANEA